MEVYRTLEAVINTVEQVEKLGRARLSCGTLAIIDFCKLKYNKRLEGAQVFKMLFNLEDNTSFAKMPMDVDENGYITLLKELSINSHEWSLFNTFLHFGDVPGYKQYLKYRDRPNYNLTNSNLEALKIVCDNLVVYLNLMYYMKISMLFRMIMGSRLRCQTKISRDNGNGKR